MSTAIPATIERTQAILRKTSSPQQGKPWIVEWVTPCGLHQKTSPLTRNDGKDFLRLLRKTLSGKFFHQVKGNRIVEFPI